MNLGGTRSGEIESALLRHARAETLTSPRLPSGRLRPSSTGYGEVGICALFAQIPGEGASPQAQTGRKGSRLSHKFRLAEVPPHPDPLHSPSKTGVNALMASGEREQVAAKPVSPTREDT
jgi:hypothetical protein